MKELNGYEISSTLQKGVYTAIKENAVEINGIKLQHRFWFESVNNADYANCVLNGKLIIASEPNCKWGGENYYSFYDEKKNILISSADLNTFFMQDCTKDYFELVKININDLY